MSDQLALRRLENGDYVRVLHNPYSDTVNILLGQPSEEDADAITWQWEMTLTAVGLADLQYDLAAVARTVARHENAMHVQAKEQVAQFVAERAAQKHSRQ